jgi:hypothetical protein
MCAALACAASAVTASTWSSTARKAAALVHHRQARLPWTPDLARREASASSALWRGQGPGDKKQKDRSAPTVDALADRFWRSTWRPSPRTAPSPSTSAGGAHRQTRARPPEGGRGPLVDIERLHLKFRATPYQANRLVALLSKMFNWSGRRGERNPCVGIERFAEQKRRRYLSSASWPAGSDPGAGGRGGADLALCDCGHPAAGVHGRAG